MHKSRIALLLVIALAACQSLTEMMKNAPRPGVRVVGVSLQHFSLEGADLTFDVEVSNPYPAGLPLVDLSYAIAAQGQAIAQGGVKPSGAVPARGTKVLQIPAGIRFASVLKAVQGIRAGTLVPYTADFKLSVDAPVLGALTLPVSHQGELPIPAIPEVSLSAFEVGSLSLDRVQATAKMRVRNTNQFDVNLARMGFELALGGQSIGGANLTSAGSLAPGQESTLSVPLSFSPRELGVGVFNLLRGSESGYALTGTLEADTRFGKLDLPFSRKGNTPIGR